MKNNDMSIIEILEEDFKKAIGKTIDIQINEESILKKILFYLGKDSEIFIDQINIIVNKEQNGFKVIPLNFYTFLIISGFRPKYEDVKDQNEFITDHGIYGFNNNQGTFKPIVPLEYIELVITGIN